MGHNKLIYGIDLGTTNSSIARISEGKPRIQKSDTQKDTMSSCVRFHLRKVKDGSVTQEIIVGENAYNQLVVDWTNALKYPDRSIETFSEFKRTMGTDVKYSSAAMDKSYDSEELSAEVLKRLLSFVVGEEIRAAVITVPAKFKPDQKAATIRAAGLAGLDYCELLAEPVAASMAYGLDSKIKDGYWVVFDLGGGTFDAALLKLSDGIMKVIDTEGNNRLGGKDLDYAIVDQILLPYFEHNYSIDSIISDDRKRLSFRNSWKQDAEFAKIELSYKESVILPKVVWKPAYADEDNEPIEIDLTITREEYESIAAPYFQKAVDLTKELLRRNNINSQELVALIPVGGPTLTPLMRKMLIGQITNKADFSIDPMIVVTLGAALYASTIDAPDSVVIPTRDKMKVQLDLKYESTSVELEELLSVKIMTDEETPVVPDKIYLVIGREGWETGRINLTPKGEVVELSLVENTVNQFTVSIFDSFGNKLECEPDSFVILQGFKTAQQGATLPYNIAIEIHNDILERDELESIPNLEKNKSAPVTGQIGKLLTSSPLRPGNRQDFIEIPIYAGDFSSEGTKAIYNDLIKKIRITGDDVPSYIPEKSSVEITVKVLRDERMSFSAYFPLIDHAVDLSVDIPRKPVPNLEVLEEYISESEQITQELGDNIPADQKSKITRDLNQLSESLETASEDPDRRLQVLEDVRKIQREIDVLERSLLIPKLEQRLKDDFFDLEKLVTEIKEKGLDDRYNMPKIDSDLGDKRHKIDQLIRMDSQRSNEKIKLIKSMIWDIGMMEFSLRDVIAGIQIDINFLKYYSAHFAEYEWKDEAKARDRIRRALAYSADNPAKEELRNMVIEIIHLLPDAEQHKLMKDRR